MSANVEQPARPNESEAEAIVSAENEATIRERLATYERDKAAARPWPEVKAKLLHHSED